MSKIARCHRCAIVGAIQFSEQTEGDIGPGFKMPTSEDTVGPMGTSLRSRPADM